MATLSSKPCGKSTGDLGAIGTVTLGAGPIVDIAAVFGAFLLSRGSNEYCMVSGGLCGRIGGDAWGPRVAFEGGAVALGPLLWPCNQSESLEVWQPLISNITAINNVTAQKRNTKEYKSLIFGVDPLCF